MYGEYGLAGDGYSSRAEDSILNGCIPVVIMDEVQAVFENILEWSTFSLRVTEVILQLTLTSTVVNSL